MNTKSNKKEKNSQTFPLIQKGMDKSYEFTQQYNPELAELLKQLFIILLRPLVALRAKLYRVFLLPFKKVEQSKIPVFRLLIVGVGLYLVYSKNVSFSINVSDSVAMVSQVSEVKIFDWDEESKNKNNHVQSVINEYAPINAKQLEELSPHEYINRYKDVAISEMKKYGIPASITLGQGLIESRAGNSKLAVQNNNHFGVKCFSKKCSKGHCTNHFDDNHKDFFRKYNSVWESFRDHSKLLQKDRYKKLKSYKRDYKKWAKGLKEAGYATDKRYDKKLIAVIQKYKLQKFDK